MHKKILTTLGLAAGIVGIAFVLITISKYSFEIKYLLYGKNAIPYLFVLALFYAVLLQFVAVAWKLLLVSVGDEELSLRNAIAIFAKTQIYKYIPTNVVHFIGRFAFAKQYGVSAKLLSYAQLMEILLMALSSLSVAIIFCSGFLIDTIEHYGINENILIVLFLSGMLSLLFLIPLFARRMFQQESNYKAVLLAIFSYILYLVFFIFNGLIVVFITQILSIADVNYSYVIGVTTVSWLIGFIVPGAPGGLGVREAVFIAGLSLVGVPVPTAAVIAVAHRIIVVAGDTLLFIFELAYRRLGVAN